jgi:hypothetical protein
MAIELSTDIDRDSPEDDNCEGEQQTPLSKGQKDEDYGVWMVFTCCVSFQDKYWKVEMLVILGVCQLFEDLICQIYLIIAFT